MIISSCEWEFVVFGGREDMDIGLGVEFVVLDKVVTSWDRFKVPRNMQPTYEFPLDGNFMIYMIPRRTI